MRIFPLEKKLFFFLLWLAITAVLQTTNRKEFQLSPLGIPVKSVNLRELLELTQNTKKS